jgi:hypothetical protein
LIKSKGDDKPPTLTMFDGVQRTHATHYDTNTAISNSKKENYETVNQPKQNAGK